MSVKINVCIPTGGFFPVCPIGVVGCVTGSEYLIGLYCLKCFLKSRELADRPLRSRPERRGAVHINEGSKTPKNLVFHVVVSVFGSFVSAEYKRWRIWFNITNVHSAFARNKTFLDQWLLSSLNTLFCKGRNTVFHSFKIQKIRVLSWSVSILLFPTNRSNP